MALGNFGRRPWMATNSSRDCSCSILNAREEKLLDDEGRVQVRLICNRCGTVLDSEVLPSTLRRPQAAPQREAEATEGA
jgi:hypothetical protein